MCEKPATSQEHAPSKCIFPEQKDTGGVDYRKQLIKVPSCDEHNTAKSTDDEYLMYVLPASIATNNVGENQFSTKVKRAVDRKPYVANGLTSDMQEVMVHDVKNDTWSTAYALKVDLERVHSVIEMNARAIFFHEHASKFKGNITVCSNFTLQVDNPDLNSRRDELFKMSDIMLSLSELRGENPDVFTYRMAREGDIELIEFTFYGTSKALAVLAH
jgi:hypothetical protein